MYAPFQPNDDLFQGDVIENLVVSYIPDISAPSLFRDSDGKEVEKDLTKPFDPQEQLQVLGQAAKSSVMVTSQTCDANHRQFISVARVFILDDYDADYRQMSKDEKKAKRILNEYQRAGVRPTAFYLRESSERNFPKSVASLIESHSILRTPRNVDYLKRNRILRLHPEALEDLQFRLGYFSGRFATTDDYMLTDEERRLVRGS